MVYNSFGDADFYDPRDYVGIGKRLIVLLVDSVVLILLGQAIGLLFHVLGLMGIVLHVPIGLFLICYLIAIWSYLGPVKRSNFGTIGYRLLGIRLISAKGGAPSLLSMTMRMLMWMFGPFNLILDLLWVGVGSEGQSLRDCYLGTYLIKRNAKALGRAPLRTNLYTAMGCIISYPGVCRPKNPALP